MDADEAYVAPASPLARPDRHKRWRASTRIGFRRGAYIAGSPAALLAILALTPTAFGLGAGHGVGVDAVALRCLAVSAAFVLAGALIGAVAGALRGLVSRDPGDANLADTDGPGHPPAGDSRFKRSRLLRVVGGPFRLVRRHWLWVINVPAVLLLAFAFGYGIVFRRDVDRRLAAATKVADLDDPNWRIDDLLAHRARVPDSENSALIVAKAVSLLPRNWPAPPSGLRREIPSEMMMALEELSGRPANVRLDDALAKSLRRGLDAHRDAVAVARSVAGFRRGRHELVLGPTLIDTRLAETDLSRNVSRLLNADAAIRAHDGDVDGALDSCRAILNVGRSIGDEPFLIAQVVRSWTGELAVHSVECVLAQGEPSEAALAQMQSLVLDELAEPILLHGMRGERATSTELIRRIGAGEVPSSTVYELDFERGMPLPAESSWGRALCDHQRLIALIWMNEAVASARQPATARVKRFSALERRVERSRANPDSRYLAALSILVMPHVFKAAAADSRYQASLGTAAILLAAERHRSRTGKWPASIGEIDRKILREAPVDPFSGRAYLMEHRDGRVLIYSVGRNGKDEHGDYDPLDWQSGQRDDIGTVGWDVRLRRQRPNEEN
jgi:hypothetical protein